MNKETIILIAFAILFPANVFAQVENPKRKADEVIKLWATDPPGAERNLGPERDMSKPGERKKAGRPVIRLGNVATPQLHVFHAPEDVANGSAVVICPGGGFHILAWDLEGTEVAQWLNTIGVTAIVLKYRVPTSKLEPKWDLPVQDAQRAISYVRAKAKSWNLKTNQIGILGFSAGGKTAAITAYNKKRRYQIETDEDKFSCQPNFSILVYPAWLADEQNQLLAENVPLDDAPPTFMVHAFDDFVHLRSCIELMRKLKQVKVPSELHIFDAGGHGYGLRKLESKPVTRWADLCEAWLRRNQFFEK